jgi:Bacterial archaeo-eukaryotic release factor family 7
MMATPTQREVADLAGRHGFPSVSILMPLARSGDAPAQNRIRLHNLVREAERRLAALGVPPTAVPELLAPALPLADRTIRAAERRRPAGLALFLAPGLARCHALPVAVAELVTVGERFHLRPLLALVGDRQRFYLLALDLHGSRLFRGSRDGLRAVPLPGVPASLEEAMRLDDRQEQLQFHQTGPARPGGRPAAAFHGHGVGSDDAKDRIARYFREVDRGVHRALRGEDATLVLAGVDYLLPIYRGVTTYPHLATGQVPGNPRRLGRRALHERAWAVARQGLHGAHDAVERYQQLNGTGRTTDELARIVEAAEAGQVESLLLPAEHGSPDGAWAAAVDRAVARTVACGGAVWVLAPDQLPASPLPAAVLRY